MKPHHSFWPPLLTLAAAVCLLSGLLNFDYPAARLFSWHLLLPSVDVCLLLLPLALATYGGKGALLLTTLLLWTLFLVLRLFRIGDTVVPLYLDRPFNLFIDSSYVYGLYDLLKTSARRGDFLFQATVAALATLAVGTVSWLAWRGAARALIDPRIRVSFLGAAAVLLGAGLSWGWPLTRPSALVRLGQELRSIGQQIEQQQAFVARLEHTARERSAGPPATLGGLGGADVLLFIIESYGQVVFNQPQYRPAMTVTMDRFGRTLAEHGFEAVSSYLASSTYGGESWLAHGTLESGLRVGNDLEETALLRSSLEPMAKIFGRNGYRTVSVMPGTRFAFPQGAYFGYHQDYYAWNFQYKGPPYGWAPMPDQFVLDWVRRREFLHRKKPLFIRYALISSHASFNIQPPYIRDWQAIGDGSCYHDRDPVLFPTEWAHLDQAGEAYLRSLEYEFTLLGDYLSHSLTADSLILILGDHQPNLQLTGPGQPWSVPVHIVSRNPRLLKPFRQRGYTTGLFPAQPLPHAGMETLLPGLLEDFK